MNILYIVYKHTSPSGKVYIGITSKDNPNHRWQNGKGYKGKHFYYAVKKYGWENIKHEVLYEGLSQEEAKQKEIELIDYYDSTNPKNGYNVSPGGDVVSDKTKIKIGEISKAKWADPKYKSRLTIKIKEFTSTEKFKKAAVKRSRERWEDPEYRERTVENMQGRLQSEEQKEHYRIAATGRKLTNETKAKVGQASASRIGEKATHRKAVLQIDMETYTILREYVTARQAARDLGLSINRVASACRSKSGFCNGFLWCYKDHYSEEKIDYWKNLPLTDKGIDKSGKNNPSFGLKMTEQQKAKIREAQSVPIINLDTGKVYPSIKDAEIDIAGHKTGSISKCLNGKVKTSLGYHWAVYENKPE